eukprot:TRINITY_DN22783_c0_g1_i1.p1 TRINITY_DN22783_c0_g1~~TRINITY_DN22783_c0_g1_i1.p1  ORF type:complete len:398 (+),score=128.90 TRINITY_DN22783_c0_g1_i1:47-1240(+)
MVAEGGQESHQAFLSERRRYLQEDAALKVRERLCEQELLDKERQVWTDRIRGLESLCQHLMDEECSVFADRTRLGEEAALRISEFGPKSKQVLADAKARMAQARADQAEAQIRTRAAEREEALLEAVARERVQTSMIHANNARSLQNRAESLQAAVTKEAEASRAFATEAQALEARATLEERRLALERKSQSLQLQVTEAATLEAEKAAAEEQEAAFAREEEDNEKHATQMRRLRASSSRRLVVLEEEQAESCRSRCTQEACDADAQSGTLLTSLRRQHAAEGKRLSATKAALVEELQDIHAERDERSAILIEIQRKVLLAEDASQEAVKQVESVRASTEELAGRKLLVQCLQEEAEEKDKKRLARAEDILSEELKLQEGRRGQLLAEESRAAELRV